MFFKFDLVFSPEKNHVPHTITIHTAHYLGSNLNQIAIITGAPSFSVSNPRVRKKNLPQIARFCFALAPGSLTSVQLRGMGRAILSIAKCEEIGRMLVKSSVNQDGCVSFL